MATYKCTKHRVRSCALCKRRDDRTWTNTDNSADVVTTVVLMGMINDGSLVNDSEIHTHHDTDTSSGYDGGSSSYDGGSSSYDPGSSSYDSGGGGGFDGGSF